MDANDRSDSWMMIFKCVVNFTGVDMFQNVTIPAQKPVQHDDHWRILAPRYRYHVPSNG
jgi:hypothetical protein